MSASEATAQRREEFHLSIQTSGGAPEKLVLEGERIVLGRSSTCQICYPDDIGLSRQHMAFIKIASGWQIEDLASKNGTLLNSERLTSPVALRPGDQITAGHLLIEMTTTAQPALGSVEFVEQPDKDTTTVAESLKAVLQPATPVFDQLATSDRTVQPEGSPIQRNPQVQALIRAGRELAGHRPLAELFGVILELAVDAVTAGRGVLMTLEAGELVARAARGAGFKISSTVRDRVLNEKASLLIRDAQLDEALRGQKSIVLQRVRSFMAVPLQTEDRVIGLIYVDAPDLIREFTREDLGLLTVMANVAAIRIEHARLNEVEAVERSMAAELAQAAQIQNGLLPAGPPAVDGLDIAGETLASLTVGGDYFDYLSFPDGRVGVIVGDVAGKGMPAALLMTSVQARVHVLFATGDELASKMERLNKATSKSCPDNRFITFFLAIIDPATGAITYSNAGHNPGLLIRASGGTEKLEVGGLMLGIIPMARYQEAQAQMQPGDVLVLFSDGVTEANNPAGDDFGEDRLIELVSGMAESCAQDIVTAINRAVSVFAAGAPQADDVTVLVVKKV